MRAEKEQMNIVLVGHVDHGKSTVVGRLLADTDSLPKGKLQQVKDYCKNNAKTFEYAFLLDALKAEQSQGVTIDSARCFFKSKKREYIIIDAPGHIEFLKNMISGAARAEAAILVIDAQEGIQENSKRHAYMLSLLGIRQVLVAVNKMDLVDYSQERFDKVKQDFTGFLEGIGIKPRDFIPVSAREGDNVASNSKNLSWFKGDTVLEAIDHFEKEPLPEDKEFRMPIQGVYKFTNLGDDRRIIGGRVETGTLKAGDKVVFLPSYKTSTVQSIEEFNVSGKKSISAGESTGFTLTEQVFATRGDIACKASEPPPYVGRLFKASIFWMGKKPLELDKEYKLKLTTSEAKVRVTEITGVLNSSSLESAKAPEVKRHEVADCVIESKVPLAFDTFKAMKSTGRFVLVDEYEIRGGGIITEPLEDEESATREQISLREQKWDPGSIGFRERSLKYGQFPTLMLITGPSGVDKKSIAKQLERTLFDQGRSPYFLGIGNLLRGLDADIDKERRQEHIRRLGEVSHLLLDAGLIVVATASDLTEPEIRLLRTIINQDFIITANVGDFTNGNGVIDVFLDENDGVEANANKLLGKLSSNNNIFSR
ncbi:GTP-binding protein [Candidatus Woesearchaeota archaeon]|nr:GTP-binding protein [Candidatus Woesearchaeota archaeon]